MRNSTSPAIAAVSAAGKDQATTLGRPNIEVSGALQPISGRMFTMEAEPVRIACAASGTGTAPIWVAAETGIFAEEGIEPAIGMIPGSPNVVQALIDEDLEFGNIASPAVVKADLLGADLVYVTSGHDGPVQTLISHPTIADLASLRGKSVGSSPGINDHLFGSLLKQHGLRFGDDVQRVVVSSFTDSLAKLDSGEIAAAMFAPPSVFVALDRGFRALVDTDSLGIQCQLDGLVARRSYIETHPFETRALVKAYVRGIHRWKNDPALAMAICSKYGLINDEGVARRTHEFTAPRFTKNAFPSLSGLAAVMKEIVEQERITSDLDPSSMVEDRFIRELDESGFVAALYGQ